MAEKAVEILEAGDIYFLYKPKIGIFAPKGPEDVQRFYMILKPTNKNLYRLIVIAQKRLASDDLSKQKSWGYVESIVKSRQELEEEFKGRVYATKTVGERGQPSGRPAGEGIYEIVNHKDHTHLIYSLSLPKKLGEVQDQLGIRSEGNYIMSIINPATRPPPDVKIRRGQRATYPQRLQNIFGKRHFIKVETTALLDYPGTALLFIPVEKEISRDLGIELEPEIESEETAKIFQDLRIERSTHSVEPLFTGRWA